MTLRPSHALLTLLLGLGACADPAAEHLGGFGDPVRGAAVHAPWWLGDTSRLAGQPAQAARAAVQMEVLAEAFRSDPRWMHTASLQAWHGTGLARAELRAAIGIAPDAPSDLVIASLRDAAAALDAGSQVRAEAALTGPAFIVPPQDAIRRLSTLPRLPRVTEGANAAFAEMRRAEGRRGG